MKKFVLIILVVGLWGTGGAWVEDDSVSIHPKAEWTETNPGEWVLPLSKLADTCIPDDPRSYIDPPVEDSLYVKKCRVDTIGWVAEVCETYFEWESDFGIGCTRSSGGGIYAVGDRLVWNRKEKPPTFHWIVRTKTTCWYVLSYIYPEKKSVGKVEIKTGEIIDTLFENDDYYNLDTLTDSLIWE